MKTRDYYSAVKAFERTLKIMPDNGYALCKLCRIYGIKYLNSHTLNLFRNRDKDKALFYSGAALKSPSTPRSRINWLGKWLKKKKIMD